MLEHLDSPRLIFMSGERKGETYLLQCPELTVGRKSDNDVVIKDTSVSRYHLLLIVNANQVWLEDRSSHGSKVNGDAVSGRMQLSDRDVIAFGSIKARVEIPDPRPEPASAAQDEPAPQAERDETDPGADVEPSEPSVRPPGQEGDGISQTFNLRKEMTETMNVPVNPNPRSAGPPPLMIPPRPEPYIGAYRIAVLALLVLLLAMAGVIAFRPAAQPEWEYRVLRVTPETSLEAELNRLGKLGWELVESSAAGTNDGNLVLKRRSESR